MSIKQYTDEKLFGMGMWNCLDCGHINSVDHHRCDKCLQDKFIIVKKNAPKWNNTEYYLNLPLIEKEPIVSKFTTKKPIPEIIKETNNKKNHNQYRHPILNISIK